MKELNLSDIRIDGGTQARVKLNQDKVKLYAEQLREGDTFPASIVYHDGSSYWLADGFHRYFAYKNNATKTMPCEVRNGTLDEAVLFSWTANSGRGLDMTPEDNRNILIQMLNHPVAGKWSLSQIAKWVGVSKSTVSRVKNAITEDKPEEVKYTNKHGQEATMKVGKIGKPVERPTTKPDVSSAPSEVDILTDKIRELTDTIDAVSEENTVLRDKIALGQWDASDIEKIDAEETIKELREQIRLLEIDNKALRESRDMFQNRNAELIKSLKSAQNKLKKYEQPA